MATYEAIGQEFNPSNQWQKFQFTFTAPEQTMGKQSRFGPSIQFNGSGKLFVDNVKLASIYDLSQKDDPFIVNQTILQTFLDSQPEEGKKGHWRTWSAHNEYSILSNPNVY